MPTPVLTQVLVDAVDASASLLGWNVQELFLQEIDSARINLTQGVFTTIPGLQTGSTITIKRGVTTSTDQFVFDGFVDKVEKQFGRVTILAKGKLVQLLKRNVSYSYDGVSFPSTEAKGSDIATSLIETHGGMTANATSTGSIKTLKKFICNDTDIFSRLQTLAEIYAYQLRYEPSTGLVNFTPKGGTTNTNTLYVGGENSNTLNMPKWDFDSSEVINNLKVKGAVQEVREEETFNGDNTANQVFTTTYKPVTVQTFEVVGGSDVLKSPGVEDSTITGYDYDTDKENKTITATSSWTPASSTDNVKIVYTRSIPVPIQVDDPTSQGRYLRSDGVRHYTDIQTVEDGEQRAQGLLDAISTEYVRTMIKPSTFIDYNAGELVRVIDTKNNEDRTLLINKIVKKWPHQGDELSLGDKEWKLAEWQSFSIERIRRLEEEQQLDGELLVSLKRFNLKIPLNVRYMKVLSRSITGDGFILGHPNAAYSTLGTTKLGSPFSSEGMIRIIWPGQKVVENYNTTDFKNVATTADWDVSAKVINFTTGEIAQSEIVYDNATTITKATINNNFSSGSSNVTFELRVDGNNWESVTTGVEHTFTNTGAELEWKATSTGTATISKTTINVTEA